MSIIIPTLNNKELLEKCIDSVLSQTYDNYEVLVVDGASTDGTVEYLKSLGDSIQFISEKDNGIYHAMNKGIKRSKGKWLFFLGDDDVIANNFVLENVFSVPLKDSELLILGKAQFNYSNKDSVLIKKNNGIFTSSFSNLIWIKNTIHHQSVFYKSSLFVDSQYNLEYKILADYAFNLNLFKKRIKYMIVDQVISNCGTSGLSKKYTKELYKEEVKIKMLAGGFYFKPLFLLLAYTKYLIKKVI